MTGSHGIVNIVVEASVGWICQTESQVVTPSSPLFHDFFFVINYDWNWLLQRFLCWLKLQYSWLKQLIIQYRCEWKDWRNLEHSCCRVPCAVLRLLTELKVAINWRVFSIRILQVLTVFESQDYCKQVDYNTVTIAVDVVWNKRDYIYSGLWIYIYIRPTRVDLFLSVFCLCVSHALTSA